MCGRVHVRNWIVHTYWYIRVLLIFVKIDSSMIFNHVHSVLSFLLKIACLIFFQRAKQSLAVFPVTRLLIITSLSLSGRLRSTSAIAFSSSFCCAGVHTSPLGAASTDVAAAAVVVALACARFLCNLLAHAMQSSCSREVWHFAETNLAICSQRFAEPPGNLCV